MQTKTRFVLSSSFKWSLNLKDHALQSELSKVGISNFLKFELPNMSSKFKQAFKKMEEKKFHQTRAKKEIFQATIRTINQCKIPYMRKNTYFCKNALLCIINNLPVVLEIIISKFSYCLKMMSRNTFAEPQPDSVL